ncbi:MAG: signal peptidase I [Verrucomicrobiales bacterium]
MHDPDSGGTPDQATSAAPGAKRAWVGVLLSLIIPGFGLARAGHYLRGLIWFVGAHLVGSIVLLLLMWEKMPAAGAVVVVFLWFLAFLWMLKDSARPGRMNWVLFLVFPVMLLGVSVFPPHAKLVAKAYRMPTSGMMPTIMGEKGGGPPDHFLVNRLSYLFSEPERGDLIAFKLDEAIAISMHPNAHTEVVYLKRIVGLPGERITFEGGFVLADGVKIADGALPPVSYEAMISIPSAMGDGAYQLGDDEYFVVGDNVANSADSRMWGGVPEEAIVGKVALIYYPFSRWGPPQYPVGGGQ